MKQTKNYRVSGEGIEGWKYKKCAEVVARDASHHDVGNLCIRNERSKVNEMRMQLRHAFL